MSLECLVCGSHAVHPLSLGKFLGPILLHCLMCGLRAVHSLLLGEFLSPMLLDCLVCIVYPLLFFGEFLLPLYFRETLFLVHAILLPLFTWAFCSFPLECLLCVSLAL